MKATIEFNLPDEQNDWTATVHANAAWSALQDIDEHCRSVLKHGHDYKCVEALAERIRRDIADALCLLDR